MTSSTDKSVGKGGSSINTTFVTTSSDVRVIIRTNLTITLRTTYTFVVSGQNVSSETRFTSGTRERTERSSGIRFIGNISFIIMSDGFNNFTVVNIVNTGISVIRVYSVIRTLTI